MRQRVERRDTEWDCERDPLSALTHANAAAAHAVSPWVRDAVKLAFPSWSCRRRESVTASASCYRRWECETHARPTCRRRRRRLLDLPSLASLLQPSQFTGIYFYLFLQNLIKCLWLCDLTPETENLRFIESRNCACVVRTFGLDLWCFNFHVWVFCACVVNCDELCLSVRLLPVGFFFFFLFGFLALWLCHSMFVTSLYR